MDVNEILSHRDKLMRMLSGDAIKPSTYPLPAIAARATNERIGVRLLRDGEIDNARIDAQRWLAKQKVDIDVDPDLLEREVQRQLIWCAMVLPDDLLADDGKPIGYFSSDKDVRELPSVTVQALFDLYLEHQQRCSPQRAYTPEQLVGIARQMRTAPGSTAISLSQIDHGSLVQLVHALVITPTAVEEPPST